MSIIEKKIDELIEIAELENDNNVLIVLLALRGSMLSGNDELLAKGVKNIISNVLLPKVVIKKNEIEFNKKYKNYEN
jgi:hypothetical protein